jgi:tripartite-type tricarboxylate transporter receptor subunit TctC
MASRGLEIDRNRTAPRPGGDKYPDRPITLTLPFPLGGSTGYTAEFLARALAAALGQRVTVEVKSGNFGFNALHDLIAHPDGYTVLVGNLTSNSMSPVFHRGKLRFDYLKEIAPVTKVADFPSVVMIAQASAANSLTEFFAHLRATSGQLVYGTDFLGAYVDVDAIDLGKASGLRVAYHATDGASGILADLLAGRTDIAFINVATATANIGKFQPLAVYGSRRLHNFPGVPTMAEAGFAGIGTGNWQGVFTSRRVPRSVIERLHHALRDAMQTPGAADAFDSVDAAIVVSASPEAFEAEIKAEMALWERMKPQIMALPAADRKGRAPCATI